MSSMTVSVDPSTRVALASLRRWLVDEATFCPTAMDAILAYAREHGTLDADCPYLWPGIDLPAAEEAFAAGFSEVDASDPAWGSPTGQESPHDPLDDVWTSNDTISLDGDDLAADIDLVALPPIAGGAPEPSEDDLRDYAEWSAQIEASRDYYDRIDSAARNAVRTD